MYLQQLGVLVFHHQDVVLQLFDLPLTGDLLQLQLLASIFLLLQVFFQFLHEDYRSLSICCYFATLSELTQFSIEKMKVNFLSYITETRNYNLRMRCADLHLLLHLLLIH